MRWKNLPKNVKNKIQKIKQRTKMSRKAILSQYEKIFNNKAVQQSRQFQTEEDKHKYASKVLWARLVFRGGQEYVLIPCGYSSLRVTQKKEDQTREERLMASLYAAVKTATGQKLRRIIFKGAHAKKVKDINLFSLYKVRLSKFKSGDLFCPNSTTWGKGKAPKDPIKPKQLFDKLGVPRVQIAKLTNYPSKQGSDGYTIRSDWRCVNGLISRENSGTRDDGTKWAVYNVIDESLMDQPDITESGEETPDDLTVWHPYSMHNYGVETECDFYGSVTVDEDGVPSMNACYIDPKFISGE